MEIQHRPGRGCPCARCEKRRQYQKDYYQRKKQGLPIGVPVADRYKHGAVEKVGKLSRLVETKTPEATVVHWLPKDVPEWTCPCCGRWFLLINDNWTEPWVA